MAEARSTKAAIPSAERSEEEAEGLALADEHPEPGLDAFRLLQGLGPAKATGHRDRGAVDDHHVGGVRPGGAGAGKQRGGNFFEVVGPGRHRSPRSAASARNRSERHDNRGGTRIKARAGARIEGTAALSQHACCIMIRGITIWFEIATALADDVVRGTSGVSEGNDEHSL